MSSIYRFSARSSGRDLTAVRRPAAARKGRVKVEKPAPEPKAQPLPKGTTSKPESNDADVAVSDG